MNRILKSLLPAALIIIMPFLLNISPASGSEWSDVTHNVPAKWQADVERVLVLAAEHWNDTELTEALGHYPPGTEKYRAVCFLVAQLDKHLYVDYVNPDDPLNPFSPEDGNMEWHREYIWDYQTITSESLIENVEWSFRARNSFPWCRSLPQKIFFEYVLPYRSTQEPIHSWRPLLYEQLAFEVEGMKNSLQVAEYINQHNTEIFHFDSLYYRHPEDNDIWTLLSRGAGRCEDMSNLSNYSLRAVGVATTSDFTPWWPKGDNNHAWNTVYHDGRWYQFMGCDAVSDPVWDRIKSRTFAKVWRNSFSAEPIMGPSPDGTLPPRLMRSAAVDVTPEYTTVSDMELQVDNPDLATYLCVFNFGTWRSVDGEWAENGKVFFNDVGNRNILYCPTRYIENESGWGDHFPVSSPVVLHEDSSIDNLDTDSDQETIGDIILSGWNDNAKIESGIEITLFRYVDATEHIEDETASPPITWEAVATLTSIVGDPGEDPYVVFPDSAVENGLFIISDNPDNEELREGSRPFVWSSNELTYY